MQPTIDHSALEHEVSRLHVLAASLVGSDDAPDVVQDAWIAARTAAPKRALGPWLRGVVRNKARMRRRESVRRSRRESDSTVAGRPPATPDEELARSEIWRAIREELERLPATDRWLVEARFLDERSPGAIAKELDVPVGTVRSRLSRCLARLRTHLAERHRIGRGHLVAAVFGVPDRTAPAGTAGLGTSLTAKVCIAAAAAAILSIGWFAANPAKEPDQPAASSDAPRLAASVDASPVEPSGWQLPNRPRKHAEPVASSTRTVAGGDPPGTDPPALILDAADLLPELLAEWDDDLYRALFEERDAEAMRESFLWYREQLGHCGDPQHTGGTTTDAEFSYQCDGGVFDAVLGADDTDVRVRRLRTGARGVPPPERVMAAAHDVVALHNAWDDALFEARFSERDRESTAEFFDRIREELGPCSLGRVKVAAIRTALYALDCENGERTLSIGLNMDDTLFKFKVMQPRSFDGG